MRVPAFTLVLMLCAAVGLGGCVPDVVGLEAVPTPKFSRDLAQCNAAAGDASHTAAAVVGMAIAASTPTAVRNSGGRSAR